MKSELVQNIPLWADFLIKDFGKYLGFFVGPGAGNKEWDKIGEEILAVARMIHQLALSKLHAFLLFQMLGESKIQFVAQLRVPPSSFRNIENKAHRLVVGGPLWVPKGLLSHLKSDCHFPCDLKNIVVMCRAIMIKTAGSLPHWPDRLESLRSQCSHDESNLRHPLQVWMDNSSVMCLQRAYKSINVNNLVTFCDDSKVDASNVFGTPQCQNSVYRFLLSVECPFSLKGVLQYRFALRKWFEPVQIEYLADRAVEFLEAVHKHVPPCVLFTVINTFFNGWVTSARFQAIENRCYICADCDGNDSLEHYACCPFSWASYAKRFRKPIVPLSLRRFLGRDANELDEKVFLACHMYAIRKTVDLRRHSAQDRCDNDFESVIWQGHRTASLYHKGLRARYSGIFKNT